MALATKAPTSGGGIPSGRLPPQAPSSRPSLQTLAPHVTVSSEVDVDNKAIKSSRRKGSSSRRHGSSTELGVDRSKTSSSSRRHGSHRTRSASDGVGIMSKSHQQMLLQQPVYQQQQYQQQQQQQQQYYYGGYQNHSNQHMQYPNQPSPPAYGFTQPPPPPLSFSPRNHRVRIDPSAHVSRRGGSFDASNNFLGADSTAPNFGSIPRRQRSSSKEFSAIDELSSIMGRPSISPSGTGLRGMRGPLAGNPKPSHHRRTQSDSMVLPPKSNTLPPPPAGFHQGNDPFIVPKPNYPPIRKRGDSHGSMGSYSSLQHQHSFRGPHSPRGIGKETPPSPGRGLFYDPGLEEEAFLSQQLGHPLMNAGNGGHNTTVRPKTHMRQQSVNAYMKMFKGKKQPKSCKDVLFGVLFIFQIVAMCYVGIKFGPEAFVKTETAEGLDDDSNLKTLLSQDDTDDIKLDYRNIVKLASVCGAFAILVSALALAFMMAMSRRLVYVALVLSIGVSFAWGTIGIGISPQSFVPATGIITLMLTVGYMFVVWDRIPFASANLTTALTGVRDNLGLVGIAFLFQFLALVCSICYTFAYVGLYDAMNSGDFICSGDRAMVYMHIVFLVSFYWTFQVLRRIVMVTVAGTIGSWWFGQPSALCETFLQSTAYNFGSICYGSLFVGFVHFLQQITEGLRPNRDSSAMTCFYECSVFFQEKIVGCIDSLADSFTPWAFTYVGLYHYGWKDAGHKVNELFYHRGWTRIVTDDLISNVLAMVSLVIGGLSGSFAVILHTLEGHGLTNFGHPVLVSFTIGFMAGIVLSTVLFSIIDSSVCAVIVCFAGSPVEFQRIHPDLSREMRLAWKEVWPGSLDVDVSPSNLIPAIGRL